MNPKRTLSRKQKAIPDEVQWVGPLLRARFGSTILTKNTQTQQQNDKWHLELAAGHPALCAHVDVLVERIRSLIATRDPLSILTAAAWNYAAAQVMQPRGAEQDAWAHHVITYGQSVIVATPPEPPLAAISEDEFKTLETLVHELYDILTLSFHLSRAAYSRIHEPAYDETLDQLLGAVEMHWVFVRGDRQQAHEIIRLRELLAPHDDILTNLFNVSSEGLVTAVDSLLHSLTFGFGEAFSDYRDLQRKWQAEAERLHAQDPQRALDPAEVFKDDPEWMSVLQGVSGRFSGADLFDVEKVCALPRKLLDELAYAPGEDSAFFAPGDYRGWPLRALPVWNRPFLRVGERLYCFDVHSLMDHFYRVVQRVVVRLRPDYREQWNSRQKAVSEALPIQYLERMLPSGTVVFRNVFYYTLSDSTGRMERYETDAVLTVDDRLLVVEVKGGAFLQRPPLAEVDAYRRSLADLVQKPIDQALRLVQALDRAGSLALFNETGSEVVTLTRAHYHSISALAVTLDAMSQLTARAQHLGPIGVSVKSSPIWVVGLDDLRTCADILRYPFQFLHFIEERKKAAVSPAAELHDEQMHLGLYLHKKAYVNHLEQYGSNARVIPIRFDSEIDDYYQARIETPDEAEPPGPELPERIREVLAVLDSRQRQGRCRVALILYDLPREALESLVLQIDETLKEQARTGEMRPISLRSEPRLTVMCSQGSVGRRDPNRARLLTLAGILIDQDKPRILLEVECDDAGHVSDVHSREFARHDISAIELPAIKGLADHMRQTRLTNRRKRADRGRIGRNELCPCGSGRKHKKCCLAPR